MMSLALATPSGGPVESVVIIYVKCTKFHWKYLLFFLDATQKNSKTRVEKERRDLLRTLLAYKDYFIIRLIIFTTWWYLNVNIGLLLYLVNVGTSLSYQVLVNLLRHLG